MKSLKVPLLEQTYNACGPTSLAMVLAYFKFTVSLRKIIKGVGGIKGYGVKTTSLSKYAKSIGFKTHCYAYGIKASKKNAKRLKPSQKLIINYLSRGLPVIIAVRTFLLRDSKPDKTGHFIVITGYKKSKFYYADPYDAKEKQIDEEALLFAWHNNILDSDGYMLVIEPKVRNVK